MFDGRGDAAAHAEGHALIAHDKLDAGEGLEHHQLIEIAEMADAEDAARDLGQPDAERKAVSPVGMAYEFIGVESVRQKDGAHRFGMPAGLCGTELQPPGLDCLAHAFGEAMMAGEDIVEAFLEQKVERGAQAPEEWIGGV